MVVVANALVWRSSCMWLAHLSSWAVAYRLVIGGRKTRGKGAKVRLVVKDGVLLGECCQVWKGSWCCFWAQVGSGHLYQSISWLEPVHHSSIGKKEECFQKARKKREWRQWTAEVKNCLCVLWRTERLFVQSEKKELYFEGESWTFSPSRPVASKYLHDDCFVAIFDLQYMTASWKYSCRLHIL